MVSSADNYWRFRVETGLIALRRRVGERPVAAAEFAAALDAILAELRESPESPDAMRARLDVDIEAFERDLPELLRSSLGKFALYGGAACAGLFDTRDAAFEEAYRRFGPSSPFLVRRVEVASEPSPSSWEVGRCIND